MIWPWIHTHCWIFHIIYFGLNTTLMWHDRIFICFIYANLLFPQTFCFDNFRFDPWVFKCRSRHDSNEECILLADIKHSQPHITLYLDDVFLNWGGNNKRNFKSLIMILLSASLASLIPPSSGTLTRLLWIYRTYNWSNNFGTTCGLVGKSMFIFRQSLKIGGYTTCGWCVIQL